MHLIPPDAWDCHSHIYGPWARFPAAPDASYQPAEAPFSALLALHQKLGIRHGVLVQPAPYQTDHRAILAAITASGGAYFGVGLIDLSTTAQQLQTLHDGGIRGIRFNLMGHLPGIRDVATMRILIDRVRPLGWHVLLHGAIADLLPVLDQLRDANIPLVIDHMARIDASQALDETAMQALERHLAHPHCWIKVSAVDRAMQGAPPPWQPALGLMRRILHAAPERTLWGSDWPHPNIQGAAPDEAQLLAFLVEACADAALLKAVLSINPQRLYAPKLDAQRSTRGANLA